MAQQLTTIGFDADDTLWQNERFFRLTEQRFAELLDEFCEDGQVTARLRAAELHNLGVYGFGVKGFILSMIETAIEATDGRVPGHVIAQLIEAGKEMLSYPIELLPHAREAVEALADSYRIVLITKGDLLDQERKLAQSGLGDLFDGVEIVSGKHAAIYSEIFARHGDGAEHAMMVGDSMKSDVVPMVEAGGWGVFVPNGPIWEVEHADPPTATARYHTLDNLSGLAALVREIG